MPKAQVAAIVLAAGEGKRMKSAKPKVLHEVANKPLVYWVVRAALDAGLSPVVVVRSGKHPELEEILPPLFGRLAKKILFAIQEEPLGTADAVSSALPLLNDTEIKHALILNGDTPLIKPQTLKRLINTLKRKKAPLCVLTAIVDNPTGYGRVLRSPKHNGELIAAIIEEKDANDIVRQVNEINAGPFVVELGFLREVLTEVSNNNAQKEFYLTQIAAIAHNRGMPVYPVMVENQIEILGVNNRLQLAEADYAMRIEINRRHALAGATLIDPTTVRIDPDVKIGRDVLIYPSVELRGKCIVEDGVIIESGSIVENSTIKANAHIKPYCVIEESEIGEQAEVGPFAHLRPGSKLMRKAKVGNFTELKKTILGEGSKANHLSYLGDAVIGKGVNVGAGTITCNYDGAFKHKTKIEDGAFIGSDVQLVAPVRVGKNATIAAGTTVYQNVPDGALALTRPKQVNKENYFDKYMKPRLKKAGKLS